MKKQTLLSLWSSLVLATSAQASDTFGQENDGNKPKIPHSTENSAFVDSLMQEFGAISLDSDDKGLKKIASSATHPNRLDALDRLLRSTNASSQYNARTIMYTMALDPNDPNQLAVLRRLWDSTGGQKTVWWY